MSTRMKKPGAASPGSPKSDQLTGGSAATVAQREAVAQQGRRERARWHLTLGAIRAHLDEQPSRRARLAAARRWSAAIAQMAEEGPR